MSNLVLFIWILIILTVTFIFLKVVSTFSWTNRVKPIDLFRHERFSIPSLLSTTAILLMLITTLTGQEAHKNEMRKMDEEINIIKDIEKEKQRIGILSLIKEVELNRDIILQKISKKNNLINAQEVTVDFFQLSAFDQGMVTNYLLDENLISDIFSLYHYFGIANNYMKMAMNIEEMPLNNERALDVKKEIIAKYNEKIIIICETFKDQCIQIIDKLNEFKQSLVEKNS